MYYLLKENLQKDEKIQNAHYVYPALLQIKTNYEKNANLFLNYKFEAKFKNHASSEITNKTWMTLNALFAVILEKSKNLIM